MLLLQRKVLYYRDVMGDLHSNIPGNGYAKNLYELDVYDGAEDGTPALKRLEKTSKYLSSFEGIPRAKVMETNVDRNLGDVSALFIYLFI